MSGLDSSSSLMSLSVEGAGDQQTLGLGRQKKASRKRKVQRVYCNKTRGFSDILAPNLICHSCLRRIDIKVLFSEWAHNGNLPTVSIEFLGLKKTSS